MQRGSTLFLQIVIMAIGLFILGLCTVALPAGLLSDTTGYYKPIVAGLYLPAIPFFIALYQSLQILKYIDRNTAFSTASVVALRRIKQCALLITGLFTLGFPYIFYAGDRDDAPGIILVTLVFIGASLVIAVFAAVLEKLLQNVVAMKTEHDLTV